MCAWTGSLHGNRAVGKSAGNGFFYGVTEGPEREESESRVESLTSLTPIEVEK